VRRVGCFYNANAVGAERESLKTVNQYLEMPYHVSVVRAEGEDGSWAASVEELPECTASATTPEQAVERVRRLMMDWIAEAIDTNREIPEPRPERQASGRLLVRMPSSLHADLARQADAEGVSLNQLITGMLASGVAWRRAPRPAPPADEQTTWWRRRPTTVTLLLAANLVVVALAGAIAVVALALAWG
jgi:antitoxin HicB